MNILEIKNILFHYGFNEKEAKIYLALLALGSATANDIALESKLKRTTVYAVAEKLIDRGIIGQFKAKYGTKYVAVNPRGLLSRLEKVKDELKAILPELEAIEKKANAPSVKLLKGRDGYIDLLNDTLDGYSYTIYAIMSSDELNKVTTEKYISNYIEERLAKKIKLMELVIPDKFGVKMKENDTKELRETKFLPSSAKFVGSKAIYKNKVAYFSSDKEMTCLVVESEDIAQLERANFELLWGMVK